VPIAKVLVANRGEIAVRVIRAARDAGLASVAMYADPDADSLFVKLADEAFALNGQTPAETYLDVAKILSIAERSGADAVHPGYGFLAENAAFAQAVLDAGLTWIGPPPAAIDALGDKVKARHIAQKVGAPLVEGTADPVQGADEVVAFAQEFGLPIAIKAAYGGGGRGLKVARHLDEVAELFESATREAVTAFGRGECFVRAATWTSPRHVETQCLADRSWQRGRRVDARLLAAASPPKARGGSTRALPQPGAEGDLLPTTASSKAILLEAGYVGAGTCEFLVATGWHGSRSWR
jgi:acetyl-CoA/propionyl-CoA carboxylase biotin carboxyl carrier protein